MPITEPKVPADWDAVRPRGHGFANWRTMPITIDSFPTAAGTYRYYFGRVGVRGVRLGGMFLLTGTALARSASDYVTFQPFYATEGAVYQRGTPRSTLSFGVAADKDFRLHDETALNLAVPKGGLVGFDATITGAAFAGLVRPTFIAEFYSNADA